MDSLNSTIIEFMKHTPSLYEQDVQPFWDDEHISKSMLEAHLNPGFEAASRKLDFIQQSVHWISEYCTNNSTGKKLLDLGCGPGIYADLLTDKGWTVTGVDYSARSIAYANQHACETHKNIKYIYDNYLNMEYKNAFDVIIMVYCDFGVLAPLNRSKLLSKIRRALKEGGIFLLDVWNEPYLNSFMETTSIIQENGGFWSSDPYAVIQRNILYSNTYNTLEEYLVITDEDCKCYHNWNQVYNKNTLSLELKAAGFNSLEFFDDIAGALFTGSKDTLCASAYKG